VYKVRGFLFVTMTRAFMGQSYDYRQQLTGFANKIHNVFNLRDQGRELLRLVIKAIECEKAGLLFPEVGTEDFTMQLFEPKGENSPMYGLILSGQSPITDYMRRERQSLTREAIAILPEFSSLWEREKEEIDINKLELFMPLISRDRLIGVLALGRKKSGRYSLEDLRMLEEVVDRVAVSMEKEYLREQLREREAELSVINRSSSIITSSLDVQKTYGRFVTELKKVVDADWASITMLEGGEVNILALYSEVGSPWQVGERIPLKDTATEWIAEHKEIVVEPDLLKENRFRTGKYHVENGLRSIVYLPLVVKGRAIGGLVVASCNPNAYHQKHVNLLEKLASQIAVSVENSRLYAEAEHKARIDGLTGLLNRGSMDTLIASEISRHSRYGGIFSAIIFDLDSFKIFNDKRGHLAGDKLLKRICTITQSAIRDSDQAFRYGGDEFAILLPQTDIDAAYKVAERLRKRIIEEAESGDIAVTASLGLASWPADGIGPQEVLAAADAALYYAKRNGGNQCQYYSTALRESDEAAVSLYTYEDSEALSSIYTLAATVDSRDHYTQSHSKKVNEYAMMLAEAIKLPPLEINCISTCALLHDVGKIGISDEILNKPGKLTAEEWEAIRVHPRLGAAVVSHARQLAPCLPGILSHHERFDGSGYPEGLKGEDIPLEARIMAIADAYAAMTSERRYSKTLSHEQAMEEVERCAGKQFDPYLVEVFLGIIRAAPVTAEQTKS